MIPPKKYTRREKQMALLLVIIKLELELYNDTCENELQLTMEDIVKYIKEYIKINNKEWKSPLSIV